MIPDIDAPEPSSNADTDLADDTEVLVRFIIEEADFSMPEPDAEHVEEMPPQMQMMAQSLSAADIADMVLPHLRYMVAENREESLRVLRLIEDHSRELREHYE